LGNFFWGHIMFFKFFKFARLHKFKVYFFACFFYFYTTQASQTMIDNYNHPLWKPGKWALGASLTEPLFSQSAGVSKSNGAFGLRAGISDGVVLGLSVLVGVDKEQEKQNVAGKIEVLQTLWGLSSTPKPTGILGGNNFWSFPFLGLGISAGQNAGKANDGRSAFQASAHAMFGVELMLLPQFSIGLQTGIQTQFAPSKWFKVVTSTTGLQTHIYF
jgi:hypothetical protein